MRRILHGSLLALLLASCATSRPQFIQGPAGRIRVDDGGRGGLPIVFVRGNGGNRSQWSAQPMFDSADRTPADPFTGALLGLRQFGLAAALERYKGPCVALAAVAIEQPASFHKQFAARCAIEPVADAGHWLMLDRPAEVNRILDVFLGSLH